MEPPKHPLRLPCLRENAVPFKIDGAYCRLIPLNRGLYAIVDATDYERLIPWRWYARKNKRGGYYVGRNGSHQLGEPDCILMHREILGLTRGDGLTGDHIRTGETLDNRRKNLRIATYSQNGANSRLPKNNTSGFKGVNKHARSGLWRSRVNINGREITTYHKTKEEAYAHRRLSSAEHFGEFARDTKG